MASMPASAPRPKKDKPQPTTPVRVAPPRAPDAQTREERFRASLDWALKEYADTLEKLAKHDAT
jgi:hypothetical protein